MTRYELIENARKAIGIEHCLSCTDAGECIRSDKVCVCRQEAEAVVDETLEACAQIADKFGSGGWKVDKLTRSRFDAQDLQTYVNCTGRAIAEDIRSLKRAVAVERAANKTGDQND